MQGFVVLPKISGKEAKALCEECFSPEAPGGVKSPVWLEPWEGMRGPPAQSCRGGLELCVC